MSDQIEHGYHAQGITNDRTHQHFRWFEDNHPYPVSVVPDIPQDAKAQLGTVDKLAQSVIPRLVDKLNAANWHIQRLESLCEWHTASIEDLYKIINGTYIPAIAQLEERVKALEAQLAKKQSKSRKKKEPEPDISEIADYNPDTDTWEAMTVDGHRITGALIDVVEHLNGAANQMYSDDLIQFIANLEPHVKKAIAERFPN